MPNEVVTDSYAGQLTGLNTMDIRTIVDVSNGNSSAERVLTIDTAFFSAYQIQLLTPVITVNVTTIDGVNSIDDEVSISFRDTLGVIHSDVNMSIIGTFSDEDLHLSLKLAINEVDYSLQFDGKNDDLASLVEGMYYGTFSIFGSTFPNDSIKLEWRKKKVVSVIASTTLETTPVYTDEETTVTKENGYCSIYAETLMSLQSGWFEFQDVPTTIQGEIKGSDFHMEVIMVPPGQSINIVLVFSGKRN